MYAIKFQKDFIKEYEGAHAEKLDDGRVMLTYDGFTGIIIPADRCLLDVSKFERWKNAAAIIEKEKEARGITPTTTYKYSQYNDRLYRCFEKENGEEICINVKKLNEYFGSMSDCTFKERENVVFIYEDCGVYTNKLVGFIMAAEINERNWRD